MQPAADTLAASSSAAAAAAVGGGLAAAAAAAAAVAAAAAAAAEAGGTAAQLVDTENRCEDIKYLTFPLTDGSRITQPLQNQHYDDVYVPGGIGVAVHLYVVVALLVVVGGGDAVDAVAAVAVVDAGHQAVAAAGLGVADCWAGPEWKAARSQGWELSGKRNSC